MCGRCRSLNYLKSRLPIIGAPVSDKLQFVVALLCCPMNFNLSVAFESGVQFPPSAEK
jgi:hypothetical protein